MFGLGDEFEIDESFLDEVFEVEKASVLNANTDRKEGNRNLEETRQNVSIDHLHASVSISNVGNLGYPDEERIAYSTADTATQPCKDFLPKECRSRKIRPRKFPGPAGLLPERQGNTSLIATEDFLDELEDELKEESRFEENEVLSQDSAKSLDNPAWVELIKDLGTCGRTLLKKLNVASVCARAKQTKTLKVPFLALLIQNIDSSSPDPCLYLSDVTGEMVGAVHREVWENLGPDLVAGTVIVLINVGVLCAGNTASRHYLNITSNNIAALYSPSNGNDIRVTNVKPLTQPDCSKFLQIWQELLISPVQQVSQPSFDSSRQLFSTATFSPAVNSNQKRPNFSNRNPSYSANRSFEISLSNPSPSSNLSKKFRYCSVRRSDFRPCDRSSRSQIRNSNPTHTDVISTSQHPSNSFSSHPVGVWSTSTTPFIAKKPRFRSPERHTNNDENSSPESPASRSIVESLLNGIDTDSLFGDF